MELVWGRQHTPLGLCYLLIGIIGSLGHLRLMSVFNRHVGYYGKHSNTYLLHLSLAVANLGVVGGFPFPGLSYMAGRWLFGSTGCGLYAFEGMACGIASILMITLLTGERYLALYKVHIWKLLERNHYLLAIAGGWIIAIYWAVLPFYGFGRYMKEPSGTSCAINWHSPDQSYKNYILFVSAWCFFLPYLIIGVGVLLISCSRDEPTVEDYKSDVLLTTVELKRLPWRLALMSLLAWTPYACVCLQFLFRDPSNVAYLTASVPPLFAKIVISLVPFMYGLSSDTLFAAVTDTTTPKDKRL